MPVKVYNEEDRPLLLGLVSKFYRFRVKAALAVKSIEGVNPQ